MREWIKITPINEEYAPYKDIEPGVIQTMKSKYIDRVHVKFRGLKKVGKSLIIKAHAEEV